MIRATIRQTLFRQNVVSKNLPNFNDTSFLAYGETLFVMAIGTYVSNNCVLMQAAYSFQF